MCAGRWRRRSRPSSIAEQAIPVSSLQKANRMTRNNSRSPLPVLVGLVATITTLTVLAETPKASSHLPGQELNLVLDAPIATWDEAVPLGNGLLGGLLWGEGNAIRLSLDRGDLWDLRTPETLSEKGFTYRNLQTLVRERNEAEINRLFETPYNHPTPTKIPAGRLELIVDPSRRARRFELNLATAEGRVWMEGGSRIDVFFSAVQPVAIMRIPGPLPNEIRLRIPGSGAGDSTGPDSHAVAALGYPPAMKGEDGATRWFIQQTAGPLKYCVCVQSRSAPDATLVAITVTSTADDPDPLALARKRLSHALTRDYDALLRPHADWWDSFWARSQVSVPEPEILRQYYLVRYFHGAASRQGAPPMPLQGVWTADAGALPPWKGDYHNDLNTQMTYMGYQGAGHFDAGLSFLDFQWNLLARYRRFAHEFFGTPGAAFPA